MKSDSELVIESTRKRIKWLDAAKGLGIFWVVCGHAIISPMRSHSSVMQNIFQLIYVFHMPLMLCLSGYAFRLNIEVNVKTDIKTYIIRKTRRLLVPYFLYSACVYFIFLIANNILELKDLMFSYGFGNINFLSWIFKVLLGENKYAIHVWYLLIVFFYDVITVILKKLRFSNSILFIISVLCVFMYELKVPCTQFTIGLQNGFAFYIWFILGLIIPLDKLSKKLLYILPIIWIGHTVSFYVYGIKIPGIISPYLLSYIARLCAVLSMILLAQNVCEKIKHILLYFGKQSMYIYLFHQPFIGTCLGTVMYSVFHVSIIPCFIITIMLSILLPLLLVNVINKNVICRKVFQFIFGLV